MIRSLHGDGMISIMTSSIQSFGNFGNPVCNTHNHLCFTISELFLKTQQPRGLVCLFFLLRARREISETGERVRQRGGFNFGDCELRAANSQLFYPLRNQLVQHLCLPVWESGFWTAGEKEINHFLGESVLLLHAELLVTDLEGVPLVPLPGPMAS